MHMILLYYMHNLIVVDVTYSLYLLVSLIYEVKTMCNKLLKLYL